MTRQEFINWIDTETVWEIWEKSPIHQEYVIFDGIKINYFLSVNFDDVNYEYLIDEYYHREYFTFSSFVEAHNKGDIYIKRVS